MIHWYVRYYWVCGVFTGVTHSSRCVCGLSFTPTNISDTSALKWFVRNVVAFMNVYYHLLAGKYPTNLIYPRGTTCKALQLQEVTYK